LNQSRVAVWMAGTAAPPSGCAKARVIWPALPRISWAVLPSVASTSTCASTGRWRRISRSKCSGMMTAARARPPASIVSGDVAGGRLTTR